LFKPAAAMNSSTFEPLASASALVAAARREGLELQSSHPDFDQSGLDFLVVHARDDKGVPWVVRTPRRKEVREAARREARALALVRPHLPVAVPDWRIHTDEVIAYPRLGGDPAMSFDPEKGLTWNHIDPAALSATFIDSFAEALAALQRIDAKEIAAADLPTKPIDEARKIIAGAMDETRALLAPSDAVWARWQRWIAEDALWPTYLTLAHGDLHPGHTLLADDGRLVGILDWTEAHFGDPAQDFVFFVGAFGKAALATCLERFEAAGGKTWPGLAKHAAERYAAFPALAAKWAIDTGNEAVIEHARAQLAAVTAETATAS